MNKLKILIAVSSLLLAFAFVTGCDKKVGKVPEPEPIVTSDCDTVTYTKHIKLIVANNCSLEGCHDGSNSNPLLGSYDLFKGLADQGKIKARVIDAQPSRMPPVLKENDGLTSDQKKLITCWLENGKKQ